MIFGDPSSMFATWGRARIAANLLTDQQEYMWDVLKPNKPALVAEVNGRPHPDYSIVFDQKQDGPSGYVLHQG